MPPRSQTSAPKRGGSRSAGSRSAKSAGDSARPRSGAAAAGLADATDIQRLAFRPILEGKDVFGRSKTGTGKSLAFLLPAMQRFASYAEQQSPSDVSIVVLSPIKELSAQLGSVAAKLAAGGLRGAGGRPFAVRSVIGKDGGAEFARGAPCDMLVATPGVASKLKGGGLAKLLMTSPEAGSRLANVRTLILDEGDSLTDGGFMGAINAIVSHMTMPTTPAQGPDRLQLLVFSATLPPELVNSPIMAPRKATLETADTVGHGHKAVGANVVQKVVVADAATQIQVIIAISSEHMAAAAVKAAETTASATTASARGSRAQAGGGADEDAAFQAQLQKKLQTLPSRFADFGLAPELLSALSSFATPKEKVDSIRRGDGPAWKILVFCGSSMYTDVIHAAMSRTFAQAATGGVHKIHGKLEPRDRAKASAAFRERQRSVLVSTDASSRGVDYDGLTIVIQLGFTSRSEFLQRAGRVGRAGAAGEAVAVYDPAEARVVLREACKDTQETCIGDMVQSRAVAVLQAVPQTGEGSRPRSLPKSRQIRFDPGSFDPSIMSTMKDTNASRVFGTWIGGVGSNWKRLGIPQDDVIDWARRFASGLGTPFNEAAVKSKLKMR